MLKVNGYSFGAEQFNCGEVSYKPVEVKEDVNTIEMIFENNKDITDLLFLVQYIRDINDSSKLVLIMKYVPYGRMDRQIDGYMFALKYFARIINGVEFDEIWTLDNHSSATELFIHGIKNYDLDEYINKVVERCKPDYICFPDGGAMKKYPKLIDACKNNKIPYFYGDKNRVLDDSREISSYELITNGLELEGRNVLIIDDICCTGGTVLKAAKKMKKAGVVDINLWVAHCEANVIKYDIVRSTSLVSKIYTSNSLNRSYNIPEIEVIE